MIETLDAREQAILRQRFGLDGDDGKHWRKSANNSA